MIRLTPQHVESITAQALKESPYEACGYLAGKEDEVFEVYPMTNVDHSEDHFTLDPKEQFSVIKKARQEGYSLLAVYHSHPASPARPSQEDIRLAYDSSIIYIIISLSASPYDIKAFKIVEGTVFQEPIIIEENTL